jgi:predicted dehydrogenase
MGQMAHLRNYVNVPECEVVALAEMRPRLGKAVAARYGIPKVYPDHKAMFAAEKLDGVVSAQPFDRHVFLLPELYTQTRFLFTEKPIAVGVESGEKLAKAAKEAGCTHMVGYHKRSDPATMYARDLIDTWKKTGEMGQLKYVRILMPAGDWIANGFAGLIGSDETYPPSPSEAGAKPWEAPVIGNMDAQTGKNYFSFVNYYIHQVNLMRHMLGEPYKVTYAEKSGVLMAVQSDSGVAGVIEMTPYRTTIEWEESVLVAFEKGYIKLTLPAPVANNRCGTVEVYTDPGDGKTPMRTSPTLPWVHAMWQQAINFVKVIKGEIKPLCDAAEAVDDLKVAREYIRLRFGK